MSYIPWRDNPDLAGIDEPSRKRCEELAEQIDQLSARGNHKDDCGCDDPTCENLARNLACHSAHGSEVVQWLYAKGMLTLPRDTAPKDWKPKIDELVTGEFRFFGGSTPVGKYSGRIQNTARIEVPPSDGGEPTICFVDADTLRPADLGLDLVAEAGLSPVDEATRTKVFAEFDAADPNAMTHRSRTHDVRATQWNKHGDHPSVFKNDCQPTPHNENLMCCDKPSTEHGWIRTTDEDVCPGNWIVTDTDGTIDVFNAETFVSVYEPIAADAKPKLFLAKLGPDATVKNYIDVHGKKEARSYLAWILKHRVPDQESKAMVDAFRRALDGAQ